MSEKIRLTGNLGIEMQTISAMTMLFCRNHHVDNCTQCIDFINYARTKLDRCVYGQQKPACKHCPNHCYKPSEKQIAKQIMRYAGPKMLIKHPILALKHVLKSYKKFPEEIPKGASSYHRRKHLKQ